MSSNRYSALNRRPGATSGSSLFADYPGSRPSSSASQNRPYSGTSDVNRNPSPYANPSPSVFSTTNGTIHSPNESYGSYSPQRPGSPSKSKAGYHQATPNSKGQYSTSVLEELESQNENEHTSILTNKVSQLKQLTIAIGDEIRDSSSLASTINDQFEASGVRLRGTMRRMLRMAERTGVGWKVWVLFFIAVWAIFAYVWLF